MIKKGVPRNLVKFTNKVNGLRPATLLKKRLWYRCFSVNFPKFLRTPFYRTLLDDWFCSAFFFPPIALFWKYYFKTKRWKKLWKMLEFYNYRLCTYWTESIINPPSCSSMTPLENIYFLFVMKHILLEYPSSFSL